MKQLAIALALTGTCVFGSSLRFDSGRRAGDLRGADAGERRRQPGADRHARGVRAEGSQARSVFVARRSRRRRPERVVVSLSTSSPIFIAATRWWRPRRSRAARTKSRRRPASSRCSSKTPMHHSKKYDNAPMPFTQFFDPARDRLARRLRPATPASHGCVRLAERVRQEALFASPTSARRSISARNCRGPRLAPGAAPVPLMLRRSDSACMP